MTILLVEGETAYAELVRRGFERMREQPNLNIARTLADARQSLRETLPELVLADWLLPDGTCADLLPADVEDRDFPLVVMTSHGDEQVAVAAMKAGALDYVVKSPETLRDMPHIVERALREWAHIVERKRAEARIKASLREKDLLLQEIHHRTRNNMQVISSLLHFQAATTENEEALRAFRSIETRIRSMALVHDKLYQYDLTTVNLTKYAKELCYSLVDYYPKPQNSLRMTFQLEPVSLPIDSAVPFALLLNELVTNTLRHAFPIDHARPRPDERDELLLVLRPHQDGGFELRVRDNGVGLPPDFEIERVKTLGLKLVRSIIDHQLQGGLTMTNVHPGTEVRVHFVPPDYPPRITNHAPPSRQPRSHDA